MGQGGKLGCAQTNIPSLCVAGLHRGKPEEATFSSSNALGNTSWPRHGTNIMRHGPQNPKRTSVKLREDPAVNIKHDERVLAQLSSTVLSVSPGQGARCDPEAQRRRKKWRKRQVPTGRKRWRKRDK